jgi:hypothetical protein
MRSDEREKMNQLCDLIQSEQNPSRLIALVEELNELLEKQGLRCSEDREQSPFRPS